MGVKYYTHFVLTGASGRSSAEEFSGVVEVNQPTGQHYDTDEIEALLARNLDAGEGQVRLINWSRLQ
jgi:hypothetical protein